MTNTARQWIILVLITACALLPATPASAIPIIDFGIFPPSGGTISYGGGAGPLVGTGIQVDQITGIDTPLNNGTTIACAGCVLSFTTGGFTGSDGEHWRFGTGGSISIVGTAGVLMSGSFIGTSEVLHLADGMTNIVGAAFLDTKLPALTAFYGLPDILYNGGMNLSFISSVPPPGAFTSVMVLSGDVTNTPVPEPASLLLLGSGLAGVAGAAWRRHRRS